jgi:SAM-dependent methyltransferase
MFGLRDVFTYFQCSRCGCLQIAEIPSDMSRYYPPAYYSFRLATRRVSGGPARRLFRRLRDRYAALGRGAVGRALYALAPNRTLRLLSRLPLTLRSRILDVGCGAGTLLYTMRGAGFENLLGVDPYLARDVEYPNGLRVLKKTVHEAAGEWDLVMFHHSLEHVGDPLETMRSASRLLAPGGACLVRTPTVSSYAWEHYGVHWVQIDAPRHFFLHSRESLALLAEKAELRVVDVVYDSTRLQFRGSEQYLRDIPLKPLDRKRRRSVFTRAELKAFSRLAEQMNREGRGDQAAFFLERRYMNGP